jgi:hypothetical protein
MNHEGVERDGILDVIREQSLQGVRVPPLMVLVPQQDRQKTINTFKAGPGKTKLAFTTLKATFKAQTSEGIPQIDVSLSQPDLKEPLDEGDVKTLPVVGDKERVIVEVLGELIQIVAVDVVADATAVVKGCGSDLIVAEQSGGFNVHESTCVLEIPV